MKKNAAYKHADVDIELGKMDAWILAHPGRIKSRAFITRWLNRIQAPVGAQAKKKQTSVRCYVCTEDVPNEQWMHHLDLHKRERNEGKEFGSLVSDLAKKMGADK